MIELMNVSLPLDIDLASLRFTKLSIDARQKSNIHYVATLLEHAPDGVSDEDYVTQLQAEGRQARVHQPYVELISPCAAEWVNSELRPVVVGSGPAGLFCALALAKAGLRPIVVERGAKMEERIAAVESFTHGGPLDERTNIQFGEGGAGTFSDGKLNTGIKSWLAPTVLHWFANAGAPQDILYLAKPHIGTDELRHVVVALRREIETYGGTFMFDTAFVDFAMEGGQLTGAHIRQSGGSLEILNTNRIVLACGHSARDTFEMLYRTGVSLEQKPFSVGVRIEHTQDAINAAQYGRTAARQMRADEPGVFCALPAADYKLAVHLPSGRSVYTFCMCPGGSVVCATSEQNAVVTNGMSDYARDGQNANAALLVGVDSSDYASDHPLAGVYFQQQIERAAYRAAREQGGAPYQAPAQTVGSFLSKNWQPETFEVVEPTYGRGTVSADIRNVLPDFVSDALSEALPLLDAKLHGFSSPDALMTAPETRSSSPVRIKRDADYQSNIRGLYPCGEGAGYAGGIMSSAIDGLKVALSIIREEQILQASEALRDGKAAIFATDTVYGLGLAVRYAPDPNELYTIKGRPDNKPIAWLVGSKDALDEFGEDVPDYAYKLAEEHWPGALTLIVKASAAVPSAYVSAQGTIGLRMPASDVALRLIRDAGSPLVTTSANMSGEPAVAHSALLSDKLCYQVACCVCDDSPKSGIASTVVDCTGDKPSVLRQGAISVY